MGETQILTGRVYWNPPKATTHFSEILHEPLLLSLFSRSSQNPGAQQYNRHKSKTLEAKAPTGG